MRVQFSIGQMQGYYKEIHTSVMELKKIAAKLENMKIGAQAYGKNTQEIKRRMGEYRNRIEKEKDSLETLAENLRKITTIYENMECSASCLVRSSGGKK